MKSRNYLGAASAMALLCMSSAAISGEQSSGQQAIGYRIGLAFAGVHNTLGGLGIESSGGVKVADTRPTVMFDGTLGYDFAANWGIQGDLQAAALGRPDVADGDRTNAYGHGAVHLYHRTDNFLVGALGGLGIHDDRGDSNREMNYWFAGAEGKMLTGWGSVFAQAGYLDSYDRYDEGTRDAPFARLGINYFLNDNWSVKLDGAYAGGKKWTDDLPNRIFDFNVESEIRPETWPVSLFARYEFTQISYHALDSDQYRYGENFHTFMVGLKFRSGATLRDADRAPGSLDLPSFGKWVAFNANEVE